MKNDIYYSVKQSVKYWWTSLLLGLLAIGLGIWCISSPVSTLMALSIIFIVNFIVSGIFEIAFAISNRNSLNGWGWSLASGIIDLFFGLVLLALPAASIFVLIFFIGFWILFQSILGISASAELQRHKIKGWIWILIFSLLGLVLAFLLITNPQFASKFLVLLFSISLISYGLQRIFYSFRLRALHKKFNEE